MTQLRQKMIQEMQLRRFSPRTQRSYVSAVVGLAGYYKQPPDKLTNDDVKKYLLYLMNERKLSWSTCNQVVCGLRFFYTVTLGNELKDFDIPPRKNKKQLPEILSKESLERLFACVTNPKHRLLLMTTYSAGLRVSEVVKLRPQHIDSERMTIRVEQGKGNKDRYTILSERLLKELRAYWIMYYSSTATWLFPSRDMNNPMNISTAQKIYYSACRKAGITKGMGIHTLRHCFATHLFEEGIDPRIIQVLMGHNHISTTTRYMQVTRTMFKRVRSPLDIPGTPDSTTIDA